MRKHRKIYTAICLLTWLCVAPAGAEGILHQEDATESVSAQLHFGATFTKRLPQGWSVYASEEIRSVLYDYNLSEDAAAVPVAYFSRSYTAVGVNYAPIKYLSAGVEYMLRIYGTRGWQDPNDYLRHRLSVSVTGTLPIGEWKLSLRERLMMDSRTDKPDPRTTPANQCVLRHRLRADWSPSGKPIVPYAFVELVNTLNEPSSAWLDKRGKPLYGGQYLCWVRTEVGCKWKISEQHALSFFYRLNTTWTRNVRIDSENDITLQHQTDYANCIGVFWSFDW